MDAVTCRLRAALLLAGALTVVATGTELALLEHWASAVQLIPWMTLAVLSVALGLLWFAPSRRVVLATRVVAALAVASAVWGFVEHVLANRRFASEVHPDWGAGALLWAGITGELPALAPLAVALPGFLAAAATIGHPVLEAERAPIPVVVIPADEPT